MKSPDNQESLTILMVTAWSPSEEAGGVSTVIRTLAAALAPEHSVQVLINDWHARQPKVAEEAGIRSHRLWLRTPYDPRNALVGLVSWAFNAPRILLQLRGLIRSEGVDVVHLHFASSYQFYFRVLRMLGGPPYIVTLHRGEVINFPRWNLVDRILVRWLLRGAFKVIAVSNWLQDVAKRTFPHVRILAIQNGVDVAEILELDRTEPSGGLSVELPNAYCAYVGNVTGHKAPDIAIRAWAKLRPSLPDLHLMMVGEGREVWSECQRLIEELGCQDRIHMTGALPRHEALTVISHALAAVFPSRNEGLALVLLEAGALGMPVICSQTPSFLEVAEDGDTAITFPVDDADALAAGLVRLISDSELRERLGSNLRKRVLEDFSAPRMAVAYEAAYRAALGKGES